METQANHVLIGTFASAILIGAFAFILWLGDLEISREFTIYDIKFEGVSGLSEASDVFYNGIKIGSVRELSLDPDDPGQVLVRIEVDAETPVKVDSIASLEFQGLTGVAYVNLSGGRRDSAPLEAQEGQFYPVIQSRRSSFEALVAGAPDLIASANRLVGQLNDIVNVENRTKIANILTNVEALTLSLAGRSKEISNIIANLDQISEDATTAFAEIETLATNFAKFSEEAKLLVADNRPSIDQFAQSGLPEVEQLVIDARDLIQKLDLVAEQLNEDPSRFLFGGERGGYEPQ